MAKKFEKKFKIASLQALFEKKPTHFFWKIKKMSNLNFFRLYQVQNLILRTIKTGSFGLKLILKGVGVILNMAVGRGWRPEG